MQEELVQKSVIVTIGVSDGGAVGGAPAPTPAVVAPAKPSASAPSTNDTRFSMTSYEKVSYFLNCFVVIERC